jgi:hypothetical protein
MALNTIRTARTTIAILIGIFQFGTLAIAPLTAYLAFHLYKISTDPLPTVRTSGSVRIFTTETIDRVDLSASFPDHVGYFSDGALSGYDLDNGLGKPGDHEVLSLNFQARPDQTINFLVVLLDDARLVEPRLFADAGEPNNSLKVRAAESVDYSYSNGFEGSAIDVQALAGSARAAESGVATAEIVGGLTKPLVATSRTTTAVALPLYCGCALYDDDLNVVPPSPARLLLTDHPHSLSEVEAQLSTAPPWHSPRHFMATINVGALPIKMLPQFLSPAPIQADRLDWRGDFVRPRYFLVDQPAQGQADRNLFIAGVLAGVSSGIVTEFAAMLIRTRRRAEGLGLGHRHNSPLPRSRARRNPVRRAIRRSSPPSIGIRRPRVAGHARTREHLVSTDQLKNGHPGRLG